MTERTESQSTDVTNDVFGTDDGFLEELEAELNAGEIESPDVEEVGADDIVAADAETDEKQPEKKEAKGKKKPAPKKSAAKKSAEKKDADADGEPEKQAAPKRQSLSGMLPSQAVSTAFGDKMYDYCIMTAEQADMKLDARKIAINEHLIDHVDTLAKKVKEKAINVFQAVGGHATLSVYTQVALQMLKDKGEFSGVELKNKYLSRPYSPGTSSAQSSQMMQLLPALKIARREGNKLVLIDDSPLFDLLTNH